MTIHFPDVSHYNKGYRLPAGTPALIARATLSRTYRDDTYRAFKGQAADVDAVFVAYHWLNQGREQEQAALAFDVVGPAVPLMIDAEDVSGNTGYNGPLSVSGILRFTLAYRALGGLVSLVYLPKWYWQGHMGSPNLSPLQNARLSLVSSNYTTYSDSGPGWSSYGGMTPKQWQYRGSPLDMNAFRGTKEQYAQLVGDSQKEPKGNGTPMLMMRMHGMASVDLYQDDGVFITHVDSEEDRDYFKSVGIPFLDGISERYFSVFTTPRVTSPDPQPLPNLPTASEIAAAIIAQLKG